MHSKKPRAPTEDRKALSSSQNLVQKPQSKQQQLGNQAIASTLGLQAASTTGEPLTAQQEAMLEVIRRSRADLKTYEDSAPGGMTELWHASTTTNGSSPLKLADLDALEALVYAGREDEASARYQVLMKAHQGWLLGEAQSWQKVAQDADTAATIAVGVRDASAFVLKTYGAITKQPHIEIAASMTVVVSDFANQWAAARWDLEKVPLDTLVGGTVEVMLGLLPGEGLAAEAKKAGLQGASAILRRALSGAYTDAKTGELDTSRLMSDLSLEVARRIGQVALSGINPKDAYGTTAAVLNETRGLVLDKVQAEKDER